MTLIERILSDFDVLGPSPKIVTIKTKTYPRMLKKSKYDERPCPFVGVHRICCRNGIIGCSYESSVNRQRAREGQPTDANDVILYFNALELWNGKGIHEGRFLVKHIDFETRYICFRPTRKADGSLVVLDDVWKDGRGNTLDIDDIEEWLPERHDGSRRQRVDRKVAWRTIRLDHLLSLKYGDHEYPLAS